MQPVRRGWLRPGPGQVGVTRRPPGREQVRELPLRVEEPPEVERVGEAVQVSRDVVLRLDDAGNARPRGPFDGVCRWCDVQAGEVVNGDKSVLRLPG